MQESKKAREKTKFRLLYTEALIAYVSYLATMTALVLTRSISFREDTEVHIPPPTAVGVAQ